ncbi:helix-turn-helix domain-containing protein [Paraburkholderia youngii]
MAGARVWIPRSEVPRIAQRLRDRRNASGMTQGDLAVRAGVARVTLVHWEKARWPHSVAAATVNALEAALQVPPGWLLGSGLHALPDPGVACGGRRRPGRRRSSVTDPNRPVPRDRPPRAAAAQ